MEGEGGGGLKKPGIIHHQKRNLRLYLLLEKITITADYLQGVLNVEGFKRFKRFKRMGTGPRNVQENIPSLRYPRYRTVCIEAFSSNLPVHVMESGLTQQGLGCIPNKLELHFYTTKLHFYVGC